MTNNEINNLIIKLEQVEKSYKNKNVPTGGIRIYDMAQDCRKAMECLQPELQQYRQAENDGRILPCKPGDVVYRLCGKKGQKEVAPRTISGVMLNAVGQIVITTTTYDVLGETAFLTREAAESALAGEKGEKG